MEAQHAQQWGHASDAENETAKLFMSSQGQFLLVDRMSSQYPRADCQLVGVGEGRERYLVLPSTHVSQVLQEGISKSFDNDGKKGATYEALRKPKFSQHLRKTNGDS